MVARNSIGKVLVLCVTLKKEIASSFAVEARDVGFQTDEEDAEYGYLWKHLCSPQGTGVEKNEIEEMRVVASSQILTGVF
ncbi:hypothetical protein Goshw_003702 [Gossypium schwendimanii]|uniref:Uncharacterized protein n=1 Tax=Gossypium schwendimanii TaxID=34291 RepID=A0A7J9M9F9_GOSSC|nr:hypothetical protein [Gossypium schwendimanii]